MQEAHPTISQTPHLWPSCFTNLAGLDALGIKLSVKPWRLRASRPRRANPNICPLTTAVTSHTPGNMSESARNNREKKTEQEQLSSV